MTVSATPYKESYAGNGVTTVFPVPFYFLADTDLVVSDVNNLVTPAIIKVLTLTTDYTVSGTGTPTGGAVTTLVAPITGHTLTIERSLVEDQPTHLVDGDPLPASGLEQALDRIVMLYQQAKTALDRAAKFAVGSASSSDLPEPQEGYVLGWVSGKLKNLSAATAQLSADLLSYVVGKGTYLIGYLAPYTGAVGTTQQQVNSESVSIFRFMTPAQITDVVTGAASIDMKSVLTLAISTGKRIFMPAGKYKFSDFSLNIPVTGSCTTGGVLTLTSNPGGASIGQYVSGAGMPVPCTIVGGSGLTWNVSPAPVANVASEAMTLSGCVTVEGEGGKANRTIIVGSGTANVMTVTGPYNKVSGLNIEATGTANALQLLNCMNSDFEDIYAFAAGSGNAIILTATTGLGTGLNSFRNFYGWGASALVLTAGSGWVNFNHFASSELRTNVGTSGVVVFLNGANSNTFTDIDASNYGNGTPYSFNISGIGNVFVNPYVDANTANIGFYFAAGSYYNSIVGGGAGNGTNPTPVVDSSGANTTINLGTGPNSTSTGTDIQLYGLGISTSGAAHLAGSLGLRGKAVTNNGATTTFTVPANINYQYIITSVASGGTMAITLPATSATIDGLILSVVLSGTINTVGFFAGAGGATVVGGPTAMTANVPVRMIYHHATTSWYPF